MGDDRLKRGSDDGQDICINVKLNEKMIKLNSNLRVLFHGFDF